MTKPNPDSEAPTEPTLSTARSDDTTNTTSSSGAEIVPRLYPSVLRLIVDVLTELCLQQKQVPSFVQCNHIADTAVLLTSISFDGFSQALEANPQAMHRHVLSGIPPIDQRVTMSDVDLDDCIVGLAAYCSHRVARKWLESRTAPSFDGHGSSAFKALLSTLADTSHRSVVSQHFSVDTQQDLRELTRLNVMNGLASGRLVKVLQAVKLVPDRAYANELVRHVYRQGRLDANVRRISSDLKQLAEMGYLSSTSKEIVANDSKQRMVVFYELTDKGELLIERQTSEPSAQS